MRSAVTKESDSEEEKKTKVVQKLDQTWKPTKTEVEI